VCAKNKYKRVYLFSRGYINCLPRPRASAVVSFSVYSVPAPRPRPRRAGRPRRPTTRPEVPPKQSTSARGPSEPRPFCPQPQLTERTTTTQPPPRHPPTPTTNTKIHTATGLATRHSCPNIQKEAPPPHLTARRHAASETRPTVASLSRLHTGKRLLHKRAANGRAGFSRVVVDAKGGFARVSHV